MGTVYGNEAPTKFNPDRYYKAGDKVYLEDENGDVIVKECTRDGVYSTTTEGGWKIYAISQDSGEKPVPYGQFIPANYEAGDRQTVYIEENNSVIIYECITGGYYDQIDEDDWKIVELIPGDGETNDPVIEEMFGDNIYEYVPELTVPSGEKVYIINETTHEITLYQNVSDSETSELIPNDPWVQLEVDEHLPQNIGSDIVFATDIDIRNMFGSIMPDDDDNDTPGGGGGGGGTTPDAPSCDCDGVQWEDF